jgi:hypothetical protein
MFTSGPFMPCFRADARDPRHSKIEATARSDPGEDHQGVLLATILRENQMTCNLTEDACWPKCWTLCWTFYVDAIGARIDRLCDIAVPRAGGPRPRQFAGTGRGAERSAALSEALGVLPLAREQAAAYCERLDVSFAEYCKRFEAALARLLDDQRDAPIEYYDRRTVAKTFALAIDEAAKLHPAPDQLFVHAALRLCGQHRRGPLI